jgi:CcmD family protein
MPSNQTFIIAAYTITWVVVLGYTARLGLASARARAAFEAASANGGGSES